MSKPTTVLLRDSISQKTHPFEPDHAKRLLAYPGTLWAEVAEKDAGPKAPAAAGKKSPVAAAAASSEADATGHPEAI